VRDVNAGHARAIAIEAAEQSERLTVPAIEAPETMEKRVSCWPADRLLVVCAEHGEAEPVGKAFLKLAPKGTGNIAFITGPEGGFTVEELAVLRTLTNALFVRLGPRVLRADTAALSVLACWQALSGDWR
jgi:16S rRNA (uracil1498-N3)-methyltransferase